MPLPQLPQLRVLVTYAHDAARPHRNVGLALGVLLTILAVAVVAWPFLRRRRGENLGNAAPTPIASFELRRARSEIYRQVRQLELDHAAGLVDDGDFRAQLDDLRSNAARLMMQEAGTAPMSGPAADLEREIEEARAALAQRQRAPGREDKG